MNSNSGNVNICLVVGLPGSGKRIYLDRLAKSGYVTVDSPNSFEDEIVPFLLNGAASIAIADSRLCLQDYRREFIGKIGKYLRELVNFQWVYFENDPFTCVENLEFTMTNPETLEVQVWELSQEYQLPLNVTPQKVVTKNTYAISNPGDFEVGQTQLKRFRLIRLSDNAPCLSVSNWNIFSKYAIQILAEHPENQYKIIREQMVRSVTEIQLNGLG